MAWGKAIIQYNFYKAILKYKLTILSFFPHTHIVTMVMFIITVLTWCREPGVTPTDPCVSRSLTLYSGSGNDWGHRSRSLGVVRAGAGVTLSERRSQSDSQCSESMGGYSVKD